MTLFELFFCAIFVGGNECRIESSSQEPTVIERQLPNVPGSPDKDVFRVKSGGGGGEPPDDPPKDPD